MSKTDIVKGSCLCGAVRFEFAGPIEGVVCCHCSQCRKQTGHHFATVTAPRETFRLTGEDHLVWYHASEGARRGFCGTCGSTLIWEELGADTLDILAGGIDGPTGAGVRAHIYVAGKGDYYELCDDAPRYPAGRS